MRFHSAAVQNCPQLLVSKVFCWKLGWKNNWRWDDFKSVSTTSDTGFKLELFYRESIAFWVVKANKGFQVFVFQSLHVSLWEKMCQTANRPLETMSSMKLKPEKLSQKMIVTLKSLTAAMASETEIRHRCLLCFITHFCHTSRFKLFPVAPIRWSRFMQTLVKALCLSSSQSLILLSLSILSPDVDICPSLLHKCATLL